MKGYGSARILLLIALIIAVAIPVSAFFRFQWFYAGKESFSGNLCAGLDADENELWYANYDAASPDSQQIDVFDANKNEWTKSFTAGPEGMPIAIFRFVNIQGTKVLTGGPSGAAVYDRSTGKWKAYTVADGLPTPDVYYAVMKDDEIWFGTNEGIGRVDGSGNWKYYSVDDGLADDKVLFMVFDGPTLWVCTGNGVSRFNTESGEWKTYRQQDGLPGDTVLRALVDGNNVWFAVKGGIARLDKTTDKITSYTPSSSGLLSDDYKDVAIFKDKIYFACNRGVNYRDKDKEGKWKKITHKNGLPPRSDASHLAVQGDSLWIALWYEGIMRMTIPTGLAIVPTWLWIVLLAVLGIAALVIIRPGAEKGEVEERKKRLEQRRKKVRTQKPPHEICGGVPKKELCNRCGFNTLKGGKLWCAKYNMAIEYEGSPAKEGA